MRQKGDEALAEMLLNFAEESYRDFSRFRFAEEREWYECALFYQRRQWLRWDNGQRRWDQIKPDPKRPRPMPVSNYFAMTVNANANQLGIPRMMVTALSDDDGDRRAADMAEKAIAAIDREAAMEVLDPILRKHTVLWGMGIAKDCYDTSYRTGRAAFPVAAKSSRTMVGCYQCGQTAPLSQEPTGEVDPQPACPHCGSGSVVTYEAPKLEAQEIAEFSKGKITTEIRTVFEVFLPRDCQNPNLAKRVIERHRVGIAELRRIYGDAADDVQPDTVSEVHEIYLEALRSLVNYNYAAEEAKQYATVTECWFDWDELPKQLQEHIEQTYPKDTEKWQALGGFVVGAGGEPLDYGVNPNGGKKPYTFYLWEMDPANVYPKGLGVDLVPLQKRLNRLDSLMELGAMANAAGKWLWPNTQTNNPPPSGTPNEVITYDVVGDGKIAPTFVQPTPFHPILVGLRQQVLADFQQLGLSLGVSRGEAPPNAKAFRALAYLGAKASEQLNTPRFLYELGHRLRYEKCLELARRYWDTPRLAKVAGPNGGYLVEEFTREDLAGNYDLDFVPDSSRPRSLEEKQEALAGLLEAGMVDPSDITTRDYVLDLANLEQLNLVDHLQYLAAQRALDGAKRGIAPAPNPFIKYEIFLRVFADFTLREEFAALPPPAQALIMRTAEGWANQLNTIKNQMAAPGPTKPQGPALAAAMRPANPLQGVPGASVTPQAAEHAAVTQGQQMAEQMA